VAGAAAGILVLFVIISRRFSCKLEQFNESRRNCFH